MNFISRNPEDDYNRIECEGLSVFIDKNDTGIETIENIKAFCRKHGYGQTVKATAIYFLRGHLQQCDQAKVLTGILEADSLPKELWEIVHCLTFWNQEGKICHGWEQNRVRNESYEEFMLKCIASDCKVFVDVHSDKFITAKGGNHVWVSHKHTGSRILIVHF